MADPRRPGKVARWGREHRGDTGRRRGTGRVTRGTPGGPGVTPGGPGRHRGDTGRCGGPRPSDGAAPQVQTTGHRDEPGAGGPDPRLHEPAGDGLQHVRAHAQGTGTGTARGPSGGEGVPGGLRGDRDTPGEASGGSGTPGRGLRGLEGLRDPPGVLRWPKDPLQGAQGHPPRCLGGLGSPPVLGGLRDPSSVPGGLRDTTPSPRRVGSGTPPAPVPSGLSSSLLGGFRGHTPHPGAGWAQARVPPQLKWCAWIALYCSFISFANSRSSEDTKQMMSSFM